MEYDVIKMNENTWRFEENGVRFFLLTGEKEALLIDTGMMIGKAREAALEITELPLKLLNTHADPDHIGSNKEFEEFYMNPKEEDNYRGHDGNGRIVPVNGGDVLDLGNRPLEIIELAGHTPGSIAVLDRNSGILFSGDPIQDGNVFMFGPRRNMEFYIKSLKDLRSREPEIKEIFPSHGTIPLNKDFIEQMIAGAENVVGGRAEGNPIDMFGNQVMLYKSGNTHFLCDR
ncbi:MBL fold metallo-hydrolase [Treponema sp.]|uniref:MBL fold metallo-hydrolase n=1 Tax=Treponema sp. TaxID=166 RepID=UPI00298EA53F|nr:MBL fold metallo-hydrolase [Treponema sp.]MCQ2241644.1 MBL fold metallo-hydrolase [Treponema sp.]